MNPSLSLVGAFSPHVLKLTRSSYLPGPSTGPHNCDGCGADGTVAVLELAVRGGSDLG